jgi:hypothetical protein
MAARLALLCASLLGRSRLRVGPDPDRGFRMEGLLEVEVETWPEEPPPSRSTVW